MSLDKEYENIFSLIDMFSTKEKVCNFFTFFCENTIKECNRIKKSDTEIYYPIIYSKEHETLSISFNFFIRCIAKFYDAGNKQTEELICNDLKIGQGNESDYLQLHNNRTLILVNILQDYYSIIHPNNRRINATKLKGFISVKDSYFIPIVYENEKKEPIQYETIPLKMEKLLKLGVSENLIDSIKDLGCEHKLKDVAFNQREVNNYWENSRFSTRKRYE